MKECTLLFSTLFCAIGAFFLTNIILSLVTPLRRVLRILTGGLQDAVVPAIVVLFVVFYIQIIIPKHITIVKCDAKATTEHACLIDKLLHRG